MDRRYVCPVCGWTPDGYNDWAGRAWEDGTEEAGGSRGDVLSGDEENRGEESPVEAPDHCPNCLSSIHEYDEEGIECGGTYEPVSIWVKSRTEGEIIQRCEFCGAFRTTPIVAGDNPIKIMSIACRPLSSPPFPIERMKELTDMMGGQGSAKGYYDEDSK